MKIQTIISKATLNKIAPFCVSFFSILSFLVIFPIAHRIEAENAEATAGTSVASAINLTTVSDYAAVSLHVDNANGTFATSTTEQMAKFSVTTTNYTGYTLSILAADDDATLVSEEGEELESIASSLTPNQFNSSTYNGKWGYKPSKYDSQDNTIFRPSPNTHGTTLDSTTTANMSANEYTIALGVRADYTKPSGIYTKSFIITAVSNPISYSISFNKNTTDTVSGMPSVMAGDTTATSINLSSNTPTRTGYTFAGWCGTATTKTVDGMDDVCSDATFQPNDAFGINQMTPRDETLYAIWIRDSWGYMQNLDLATCKSLAADQELIVTDSRNNYKYPVRFVKNTCVMAKNLMLAKGTTLTPATSNVSSNFTLSTEDWTSSSQNYYCKQIMAVSGNDYYYNWYAATANPYACSNPTDQASENAANASHSLGDICPKNWRLPEGPNGGGAEYTSLFATIYGTSQGSGKFSSGSKNSDGYNYLWGSATSRSDDYQATFVRFSGLGRTASGTADKYSGHSVRCLLNTSMQTQTASTLAAAMPNSGDTAVFTDRRDTNSYQVTNINGKYWMTQDLLITGTIRADDSNFGGTNNVTVNISEGDLTSGNSFTEARTQTGTNGNGDPIVFYNFCAAAATTDNSCTDSAEYTASTDICPKGWRLPTSAEATSITDYASLFNPVNTGSYHAGGLGDTNTGRWWTSTASADRESWAQDVLGYITDDGVFKATYYYSKVFGNPIRCIFSETGI